MSDGRDLDLPRRHALMGVPVIVVEGFATRGKPTYAPKAGLNHHTACAPGTAVAPSLGTVINGRPDLPGPLCNTLQDRNDVAREVASGRANHGGAGHWRGVTGNSNLFGCEVEFSGTTAEPFSAHRFDTAARIQAGAALGRYDADMVCQHLEYAEPKGRKIDLLLAALQPHGGLAGFRDRVQHYIDHPPGLAPVVKKPIIPKLIKAIHVGYKDTDPKNPIGKHIEELLLWNAVKRGEPNRGPGKVNGEITGKGGTAEAQVYFRRWFYDLQVAAGIPAAKRVFKEREYPGVSKGDYSQVVWGPKTLAALEWAAAA